MQEWVGIGIPIQCNAAFQLDAIVTWLAWSLYCSDIKCAVSLHLHTMQL